MSNLIATTKPGKKYRSLRRPRTYEALRKQGYSKQSAARISNAQAHKAFTLDQLESFVSSEYYDSATAGAIAQGIPALKAAGAPGEHIAPGITRIRGNLCNVHGKYGPCDKGLSGKKPKGGARKPAKARQTPAQRAQARQTTRDQNASDVAKQMAANDTGLSPSGSKALLAFAKGQQPDAQIGDGLARMGLAERAEDGSYRMTPTGRAVVGAMAAGDYQRAVDGVSRATDQASKRSERTAAQAKRQQDSAGRRTSAAMGRELAKREREAARAKREQERVSKKPAKASAGGGKKPGKEPVEKPLKVRPTKRRARSSAPSVGGVSGTSTPKPKPAKEPAKQIAPALQTAADQLSQGAELSDADAMALIRNGLAKPNKDGVLILTAAGMRATQKDFSFRVFKDASGHYRWVAQSSTAFEDRDKEIVSTKALEDDCRFADSTGTYGPLRWWHTPGLDLGDCDFNAMHGRVLIESGTFRSPVIAQKVAQAAPQLEISLGFFHLPTEPDADGVFHHIRRFERSLVPRGKASNRYTAFTVKETVPMDETKIAYLRTELKFSDAQIAEIQATAAATEKAAIEQHAAFKADEPAELPDVVINGITYKAFPPKPADEATPVEAVVEEDAMDDMPMDEEPADDTALTLSSGDLAAIGEAIGAQLQGIAAQIMGALDLEKKVAGHVQGLMAPFQAQKDATDAEKAEQIAQLQTALKDTQSKLDELLGLQPAVAPRASANPATALNPFNPADNALLAAVKDQVPSDQQPFVNGFEDLKLKLFGA